MNTTVNTKAPSQSAVLAWVKAELPQLDVEIDRKWVWVTNNLSGPENKPVREKLKAEARERFGRGFKWAKKGHPLPSGKTGTWGHSCKAPIPFYYTKGGKPKPQPTKSTSSLEEEAWALLEG